MSWHSHDLPSRTIPALSQRPCPPMPILAHPNRPGLTVANGGYCPERGRPSNAGSRHDAPSPSVEALHQRLGGLWTGLERADGPLVLGSTHRQRGERIDTVPHIGARHRRPPPAVPALHEGPALVDGAPDTDGPGPTWGERVDGRQPGDARTGRG